MPSFKTSKTVMDNTDGLYAYLKGRANGDITQARVGIEHNDFSYVWA